MTSGALGRLIEEDGLRGMTSNPSLFEKAIGESHVYDDEIHALALQGKSVGEIYDALSQRDVQSAADLFRPLYDKTDAHDGYVSLEVNPHLAHDTDGTVREARRLWIAVNRPNVLIKVPATVEGLPAIQHLISEGININVTLLFGVSRYCQVAEAYMTGIEALLAQKNAVSHVASVASFFVSRIDVRVDPILESVLRDRDHAAELMESLCGHVAIASAKIAYQRYKRLFNTARFKILSDQGARCQRLLWASTAVKNPAYCDVKYIEALIGRDTIDTAPLGLLEAFRDHGVVKASLEEEIFTAARVLKRLPRLGIDMDRVAQQLENEGVAQFNVAFDKLMETLASRVTEIQGH